MRKPKPKTKRRIDTQPQVAPDQMVMLPAEKANQALNMVADLPISFRMAKPIVDILSSFQPVPELSRDNEGENGETVHPNEQTD